MHHRVGFYSSVALFFAIVGVAFPFINYANAADGHDHGPKSTEGKTEALVSDNLSEPNDEKRLIEATAVRMNQLLKRIADETDAQKRELLMSEYKDTMCLGLAIAEAIQRGFEINETLCAETNTNVATTRSRKHERRTEYWSMR